MSDIFSKLSFRNSSPLGQILLLAGISFLTILPMVFIGVFKGPDTAQHIQFASTYEDSILSGDLYPSWGGNENSGYGSVSVRFYPPIFSFLFGLAHILTGDWQAALWIVNLLFTLIGGVGCFLLAKEFIQKEFAFFAGVIFILMPYHLSEIHINSFYAEYAGCSILAFSFLFVTRICRNNHPIDVLGLAVSFALLILTHIPSAVIGSLGLFVYALALMIEKKEFRLNFVKLSNAAVFGLAATSFYWLRFISEMDWFRSTRFVTDGTFDYSEHFLLTIPSDKVFGIWYNNQILIAVVLLVICSAVARSRMAKRQSPAGLTPMYVIFAFSVFMMTPISKPLWMFIPYLSKVQFVWRWQVVTCIVGAVLISAGIKPLLSFFKDASNWKTPLYLMTVFSILFASSAYFKIVSKYKKDYIPTGEFNAWAERQSRSMGPYYFWTPVTTRDAFMIKDKVVVPGRAVKILVQKPDETVFSV
ncbi:MAG: hypothetical protein HKN25_10530, partial [Pyrinomonadaceae bacterium]|nr:hypothetical protein [Pyrinomonadaceae bacterium]